MWAHTRKCTQHPLHVKIDPSQSKLRNDNINFCNITSHKVDDTCLRQWEIANVFTITVDNVSANDVAVAYMKRRLIG